MASLLRPTLLRPARLAAVASRATAATARPHLAAAPKLALPKPLGVTAFHTSSRKAILPPEPQHLDGSVNDAAPIPHHSPAHGSYHWTFERLIAVGLIPMTVAPFAAGSLNPTMDALLCATIIIHSHIGFDAMVTDYFPQRRVPKTRAGLMWLLRGCTVLVGVGLYEFETNDVGVTEAIKRVWTA